MNPSILVVERMLEQNATTRLELVMRSPSMVVRTQSGTSSEEETVDGSVFEEELTEGALNHMAWSHQDYLYIMI